MRKVFALPILAIALLAVVLPGTASAQPSTQPIAPQSQEESADTWSPGFYDTQSRATIATPAAWARATGVAKGVNRIPADNPRLGPVPHLLPDRATTRGETLLMLWRAAGRPPECAGVCTKDIVAPPDVPQGGELYRASAWAARNGVIAPRVAFNPNRAVTRAQFVTLLWRANGSPQGGSCTALDICAPTIYNVTDVPGRAYYANAVQWGMQTGVITPAQRFNPHRPVPRGIATVILYRHYGPEWTLPTGGEWSVYEATGRELLDGVTLALAFNATNQPDTYEVGVRGGCNLAGAVARPLTEDRVHFTQLRSTFLYCFDTSPQEQWFHGWLLAGPTVAPSENGFTMTGDGVTLVFAPSN